MTRISTETQSYRFSFRSRLRSFRFAARGICVFLRTTHNAWIHAMAAIAVIVAGVVFRIDRSDWLWITAAITGVFVAEALNTAVEFLCDVVSPEFHPMVENAKDVAAGAVLMAALGAGVIGLIVFFPHLLRLT